MASNSGETISSDVSPAAIELEMLDKMDDVLDGVAPSNNLETSNKEPPLLEANKPITNKDHAESEQSGLDTINIEDAADNGEGKGESEAEAPPAAAAGHLNPLDFPDGGFGWVVVAAAFMSLFMTVGMQYAAGTFIKYYYYQNTFPNTSYLTLSFLSSLTGSGFSIFGPFAGRWADRWGPFLISFIGGVVCCVAVMLASLATQAWQMLLAQGLMFGCAETMIYLSAVNVISQWFLKRRGTAFGIAVAGSGVGGLAIAPLCQVLIDKLGWQWCLRVLGFVIIATCSLGALVYRKEPPSRRKQVERRASMKSEDYEAAKKANEKTNLKKRKVKFFDVTYFKDRNFLILYIASGIGIFGFFCVFAYSPAYAVQEGMSPQTASLVLGLANGGSAAGRIVLGWAGDKLGYLNSYIFCQLMCPIIMLFWPLAKTAGALIVVCFLYGFFAGGYISLLPVMMSNSLFRDDPGVAGRLGMQMSSTLIGSIAGTPIAGAILDANTTTDPVTGARYTNFTPMIMYAGFVMLFGNSLNLLIKGNVAEWKWANFWKKI